MADPRAPITQLEGDVEDRIQKLREDEDLRQALLRRNLCVYCNDNLQRPDIPLCSECEQKVYMIRVVLNSIPGRAVT